MRKRRDRYLILIAITIGAVMGASFVPFHAHEEQVYRGYAYEIGNTEPVYVEEFTDRLENGHPLETITRYYDPTNKLIALRTLDFSKSMFAPDFRTEDLRTGCIEGAEIIDQKLRLYYRKSRSSSLVEKLISMPHPLVVDGGFNQFMKAHWSDLTEGKTLAFHFAVPSHLDFYRLQAKCVSKNSTSMKIKIEPEAFLLRMLGAPIYVCYDLKTKRILSYEGKSNISKADGRGLTIKLVYPVKGP